MHSVHARPRLAADPRPPRPPGGRTLAIFHLAEPSGPSFSLKDSLAWLASGGELEVVVPASGTVADAYREVGTMTVLDYAALAFPAGPRGFVHAARRFAREVRDFRTHIRRTRPTLVVVVTTSIPAALAAARLEGVPSIVYAGEILDEDRRVGVRSIAKAAALRFTSRAASAVVCCSETVARQFGSAKDTHVTVAYPPIGESYAAGDREACRSRLGLGADQPCIAVVGNVSAGRGQDVLVAALPALRARFPDLRCLLVGEPHPRPADRAYERRVVSAAHEAGVSDAVVPTGFVDGIEDVYAAADVVVNPARVSEAFGRVSCEALVAGRPVVATRVGAVPEVLRDGEDALLVPANNPGALSEAIARLLEDPELAASLMRSGRDRVRSRYHETQALRGFTDAVGAVTLR